jgi:hypothetical protein
MSLCRCNRDRPGRLWARTPLHRRSVDLKLVWLHGFNLGYRSLQSLRMNGLDWPRWGFLRAPRWATTGLIETVAYGFNKDRIGK